VLLDELTPFRRRALRAAPLQAIAAVLDDAAIKWLAAVSSTSDDAVMGVAWSSGARTKIWRLASELG